LSAAKSSTATAQHATQVAKGATREQRAATRREHQQRLEAQAQRQIADARRNLALAQASFDVDPATSVQEALRAAPKLGEATVPVLRDALVRLRERRVIGGQTRWIHAAALSPDGSRFATAEGQGGAAVLDSSTGGTVRRLTSTGDVRVVAYSPDG